MGRVLPRSPQNGECGSDPACVSTATPVAIPAPVQGSNSIPLATPWSAPTQETPGGIVEPVTSAVIIINSDVTSYTQPATFLPTSVLTTTTPASSALPTSTIPSVVTLPPEAQNVSAVQGDSSDSGLSKGAVAGLAIGTTLLGGAIAFLIAWLLFKRRDRGFIRPSGSPVYFDSSPELGMLQKPAAAEQEETNRYVRVAHAPAAMPPRKPMPPSGDALAGILPPSASDHQVQSRLSALFATMHAHIDTFYRDVHASVTPSMAADLALFGRDVDMPALLQGCSRPTAALKHALVAFVIERTAPPDDPSSSSSDTSLWPAHLTQALALHNPTPTSPSSSLAPALALHRRLTIHLYTSLRPSSPRGTTRHSTPSSSAIGAAAEHFSLTFFPWLDPSLDDTEREADLAELLSAALQCRMWLLGLEGEWGFEWRVGGKGVVVVRPAVVVRGEGGNGREVMGQSVLAV